MDDIFNLSTKNSDDLNEVEESFVQEAVRASLESSPTVDSVEIPSSSNDPVSSVATDTEATTHVEGTPVSTPPVAQPAMMRFIKDVTIGPTSSSIPADTNSPDFTKVQPGAAFVKIWRVRNDGNTSWPDGTVLTVAGGDSLCSHDLKVAIPVAQPGEEVDLSINLTAPKSNGRYTAYFHLATQDGSSIGQRLCADIRVEDEEPSWQVVTTESIVSSDDSKQQTMVAAEDVSPVVGISNENVHQEDNHTADTSVSGATAAEVAFDVWTRVWAAELQVLAQMGFSDIKELIPVLQLHIDVPASLNPKSGNKPNVDDMQTVIMHLLSQSNKFFK